MNTPVLIVGAGPVGLTLACELTRYQVPVRIVDKAAQRTDKSKALVLWSRTLELLDRGDQGSAPFVEAGFKVDGVNIVTADGAVVGHVKMDSVASPYPLRADAAAIGHRAAARRKASAPGRLGRAQHGGHSARDRGRRRARRRFVTRMAAKRPCKRIGSPDATARTALCATRSPLPSQGKRWAATGFWRTPT